EDARQRPTKTHRRRTHAAIAEMKRRDATRENTNDRKRDRKIRKPAHPASKFLLIDQPRKFPFVVGQDMVRGLLVGLLHVITFSMGDNNRWGKYSSGDASLPCRKIPQRSSQTANSGAGRKFKSSRTLAIS